MITEIDTSSRMRFLCFGAGAIGTYVGGSLALAGCEIVFLDRPEVAESIRQSGLQLQFPAGEKVVKVPQVIISIADALATGPFDLAILAIKSFDTQALLAGLESVRSSLPTFLSLQNGVENESFLVEALGQERVIPGSVTSSVSRIAPGCIALERLRGIGIAGLHPLIRKLIPTMDQAGLKAKYYKNPASMKWSKMLTNLLANATSAILDLTPLEIFSDPGLFRLEIKMLSEALQVMAALGIPVTNLPGTPVKLLVWIARSLPIQLSQPLLINSLGRGRGAKMPSFHIDLSSGRGKSEVDFLNGAVVRFGQKTGVPTPVNRWLNETLLGMAGGSIRRDRYLHRPETLLAAVAGSK
ncbi:MAG TPA: 2-dehydropantoate 2-reductase [Anaerolineaceae bacterium]|nr:2-dehydropantoate 2-reductase [Anaerolineaceae bacterium]